MKILRDIGLTALSAIAFIVLAEGALRLAGIKYDSSFYRLDRDLGYVLRPNAQGWSVKERETYEEVSSQGLRDQEHAIPRPPGVIRIALIGDSFAEAKQVARQAAYWSVLERQLNQALAGAGRKVEVMNFGVAGYGLAQEYLVIRDKIWRYDPQIVILSGTLHSWVLHSSRKFGSVSAEGPVPFFELHDGRLQLDDTTQQQRQAFLPPTRRSEFIADITNESRLLSLVNAVRRKLARATSELRHGPETLPEPAAQDVSEDENMTLRGPVTPDLAQAWAVCEALLRAAQQAVQAHHAEFWFFLLDMAPQVDPDAQGRAALAQSLGVQNLFVADKMFDEFGFGQGMLHSELASPMLAYADQHSVLLHGFPHRPRNTGHWNEIGHEVAGNLMAQRLLACSAVLGAARAPCATP